MATATKAKRQGAIQASLAAAPVSSKARRQHELMLLVGQLIHTIDELKDDPLIQESETTNMRASLEGAACNLLNVSSALSTEYISAMSRGNFPWIAPAAGMAASN